MLANVKIDDNLLAEAMKISGMDTKAAVLNLALKEYLRKNNLKKILHYRGKNIWEGDIDEMRSAR
ncbi:MAG: type II toxin-antitoxin system VapB family antitoxin [Treponema sp.]|jgi:Arc/MetJ family transcription regulator|nr:type II toxin-antitoxin system VapB family antitoxin [Treponema sp.]